MSTLHTVERIQSFAKSRGISQAFICKRLGLARSYFNDVKLGKNTLNDSRLLEIADIIGTSPEYLKGETEDPTQHIFLISSEDIAEYERSFIPYDEIKKAATLSDDRQELLNIYDSLSPEMQKILLAQVKAMSAASEE